LYWILTVACLVNFYEFRVTRSVSMLAFLTEVYRGFLSC
jgi:hypothetical protein